MLLAKNRKALRNFEITEKFVAGIVLKGYEVKAAKEGGANLEGSYVHLEDGIPVVSNLHVAKYSKQSQEYDDKKSRMSRKVLLNKSELQKLSKELKQKGKTAVPLALLLKNNLVKLEFAAVKGRSEYGKKHLEKEKQIEKDLRRGDDWI